MKQEIIAKWNRAKWIEIINSSRNRAKRTYE